MTLIEQAEKYVGGAKTIMEWLGAGAETVPWRHAQQRALVCIKCPLNQPGPALTGIIADAVRKQVEIKNKLQLRVKGEKQLLTCIGCGCVLRLKVWLPISKLGVTTEELEKFDTDCWMAKELKK